jgi:hypothetical protein
MAVQPDVAPRIVVGVDGSALPGAHAAAPGKQ